MSRSDRTDIGPIISDRGPAVLIAPGALRWALRGRQSIDTTILLVVGVAATALFMAATLVRQPSTRGIATRGAVIGTAVAAVLGLIVLAVAAFVTRATLDDALRVGAVVAAAYFWLNLVILGIGLWFRPTASWAVGSALATPVILAAIGFGYAAYRAWPLQ